MAPKSNCASTPCRRLRYSNARALNPCAISGRPAPSRSCMSRPGRWNAEARDSLLAAGPAFATPSYVHTRVAAHRMVRHRGAGGAPVTVLVVLQGRALLAPADHHVVDAAGDEGVARPVEISGIAGEIPAAAQCLGVRVRAPPITLEGFVALKQGDDLARFAGGSDLRR